MGISVADCFLALTVCWRVLLQLAGFKDGDVTSIAVTESHAFVLTEKNEVFFLPHGDDGKNNTWKQVFVQDENGSSKPLNASAISGCKEVCLAASESECFFLTPTGDGQCDYKMHTWTGVNGIGFMGGSDLYTSFMFTKVEEDDPEEDDPARTLNFTGEDAEDSTSMASQSSPHDNDNNFDEEEFA